MLFINRFFYPDQSATSQLLSDLAFHLAAQGIEVHVITSRIDYQASGTHLPLKEDVGGVRIYRCRTTQLGRNRLYKRAVDYLSFYITAFACLLRRVQPGDVLVAKTDPPLISVLAALACRVKRARLVNWTQDLFPEVAAAAGIPAANGLPGRILRKLRNWSCRQAASNVVLGTAMAKRLRTLGVPRDRIEIISNWADGTRIRPVAHEDNRLRAEWGLAGKFVVEYSGNLGRAHDAATLLGAARKLANYSRIRFLFIGGGAYLDWLKQQAHALQLENILFKEYQPPDQLCESLSVGDVHLVSLKPEMEGLVFPSKLYGILAAARPVIFVGDVTGELAGILRAEGCGWSVSTGDSDGLAQRIFWLSSNPHSCHAAGVAAADVFRSHLDRPNGLDRWQSLLHAV